MTGRIIIPMITPYKKGVLDTAALEVLLSYARDNGFDGVFGASSTGGCAAMSFTSHREMLLETINRADGLTLFANISRNNLEETISMAKEAQDMGYSNLVCINPYYHRYSESSMVNYFSRIASMTDGSLYLYNNPALAGISLTPDVAMTLKSEFSNVAGVKDSGGDMERFREFLNIPDFEVFQGKDHLLEDSLKLGAAGGVCSTTNFSLNTLHVAHDSGDVSAYTERIRKVTDIMKRYEVPAFHNYMFRRLVLGEEKPSGYMVDPFVDLTPAPEVSELSGIV